MDRKAQKHKCRFCSNQFGFQCQSLNTQMWTKVPCFQRGKLPVPMLLSRLTFLLLHNYDSNRTPTFGNRSLVGSS